MASVFLSKKYVGLVDGTQEQFIGEVVDLPLVRSHKGVEHKVIVLRNATQAPLHDGYGRPHYWEYIAAVPRVSGSLDPENLPAFPIGISIGLISTTSSYPDEPLAWSQIDFVDKGSLDEYAERR